MAGWSSEGVGDQHELLRLRILLVRLWAEVKIGFWDQLDAGRSLVLAPDSVLRLPSRRGLILYSV
jgi:hypothetical protein